MIGVNVEQVQGRRHADGGISVSAPLSEPKSTCSLHAKQLGPGCGSASGASREQKVQAFQEPDSF